MDNLYYVVNWGKDKQRAWSGTNYGLYVALSKIFQIKEIELQDYKANLISRVLNKILCYSSDFGVKNIINNRNRILKSLHNDKSVFFQFSEIVPDSDYFSTYIYQDLSVSYVKYMSENDKKTFKYSGFYNNSKTAIDNRYQMQNEYYKNCKGIFTKGKWLEKDLIYRCGFPKDKVHHVGGGINLDYKLISPKVKTNNKILFVGRDFKRKGGYIVYDAFKILKSKIPNVELHIAGPAQNPIKDPIDGYFYYGDSDHDKLSELFNMCDIFCMPSYFEAYGLVFIEALVYGLPCIGRNAYEMPYFIKDNETGLLLKNDSPDELAQLMERLLFDNEIKRNVVSNRDNYIKEYSWDSVAQRIHNVITSDNKQLF